MTEYFDKYKRRLNRNGDNVGEIYSNNTIAFIEATFHASPTFRILEVSSVEFPNIETIDARVVEVERLGTLREVLFRPNQGLNIGAYVKFDGETWLVSDKWGSVEASGLKVMVQKCNRTIKWESATGAINEVDCIASQSPLGSKATQGRNEIEWNKYDVSLPSGQLFVFFEKNNVTSTIKINDRFIFGSNVYETIGVDDTTFVDKNGFGIIQLTIKITTKQDADDFSNRIAFNEREIINSNNNNSNSENGGMIW